MIEHNKQTGYSAARLIQRLNLAKAAPLLLGSFLLSACVSSQPTGMGLNADNSSAPTDQSIAAANTLTSFIDGDTGSTGTDENGNVVMVAVPARANRVQSGVEVATASDVQQSSGAETLSSTANSSELVASAADPQSAQLQTTAGSQTQATEATSEVAGVDATGESETDGQAEIAAQSSAESVPAPTPPVVADKPAKQNFFQRMFATNRNANSTRVMANANAFSPTAEQSGNRVNMASGFQTASLYRARQNTQANPNRTARKQTSRANGSRSALPGVQSNSKLFELGENEMEEADATEVASLGGFGRISPNGLRIQHEKVQVACLKPAVIRILTLVERRYGKKPVITSGYRSPKRNRRAGGARNSQHIYCKAADIQVEGVSKWDLAKFLRSIPGRGGVGTYCRTRSVHFDVGSKRDWHHPCRRSSARKRKKT